jgi:hypothetical protein
MPKTSISNNLNNVLPLVRIDELATIPDNIELFELSDGRVMPYAWPKDFCLSQQLKCKREYFSQFETNEPIAQFGASLAPEPYRYYFSYWYQNKLLVLVSKTNAVEDVYIGLFFSTSNPCSDSDIDTDIDIEEVYRLIKHTVPIDDQAIINYATVSIYMQLLQFTRKESLTEVLSFFGL